MCRDVASAIVVDNEIIVLIEHLILLMSAGQNTRRARQRGLCGRGVDMVIQRGTFDGSEGRGVGRRNAIFPAV